MSTILIAIVAVVILAGLFGAVLGFASIKFKVEADPLSIRSTVFCHKLNVVSVATQAAALTPKQLLTAMRSTSALRVANDD